ncbi:phosphate metabolism protein 7, partial [Cryomyces antarcticus]
MSSSGRNPDGTFVKGSNVASEAGHKGGLHSTGGIMNVTSSETGLAATGTEEGRNVDGTFTKGSEAAKEAG